MKNLYQIICIWSIIIIGVFILLLMYTPLGGDFSQHPDSEYLIMNKSVQLGGVIINSPKNKFSEIDSTIQNEIPLTTILPVHTRKSFPNSGISSNYSSGYSVAGRKTKNSNSASGMGGGSSLIGGRNGSKSSTTIYANNISRPFSSTGVNSNPIQYVPMDVPTPASDPGGDPVGPPLPVGDGILLLIMMSVLYIIYIYIKKLRVS